MPTIEVTLKVEKFVTVILEGEEADEYLRGPVFKNAQELRKLAGAGDTDYVEIMDQKVNGRRTRY
jgi:hypothetical protein